MTLKRPSLNNVGNKYTSFFLDEKRNIFFCVEIHKKDKIETDFVARVLPLILCSKKKAPVFKCMQFLLYIIIFFVISSI